MNHDESPQSSRPVRSRRPLLATPAGAAALGMVIVGLVALIALLPRAIPGPSTAASPTPTCSPSGAPSACPSPTTVASASPEASPTPSFVRPTPTPEPTFTSYVVKAGDTLSSIARAYATTPRSLAWWNRGTYPTLDPESEGYDPNHIQPGWTLVILPGVVVSDDAHPSPSPGGPSASPTLVPGGSPSAAGPATVITHGPRGTTRVALTFDMGGRLDPAVDIVQWLIDHQVHATIFPTGVAGTTTDLGKAALRLAATRPDLFVFGNHTWSHPDFTTLTAAQMADQLQSTETAIGGLIGVSTKPYFRPPYGAWTYAVRVGVGAAGWSRLMMWDIDTIDWKQTTDGGPTKADIVSKVVSNAQGGSIVLMHLGGWHTLEALPEILSGLQSKGLTPVTLTEMLGS